MGVGVKGSKWELPNCIPIHNSSTFCNWQYVSIFGCKPLLSNEVSSLPSFTPFNTKSNYQIHSDLQSLASHSLAETSRKARKSKNNHGSPIRLQSKILAIISDPIDTGAVYVAESAGTARRIVFDVG